VGLLLVTLNLPSDTGILVGSYEILCHKNGTTVRVSAAVALLSPTSSLGDKLAGKVQYETGTT
jgi:hypothetical protein